MFTLFVSSASVAVEEKEIITAGRVGLQCSIRFSPDWDGLVKTAVFDGAESRDVIVTGERVTIPAECLAAAGDCLKAGFYGKSTDGAVVIPTVWASLGMIEHSVYPSGREGAAPTPDVVAQIQQAAANAEKMARSVREDADLGKFNGGKGEKGEKGDRGNTGPAGEAGGFYTPAVTQPDANTIRMSFTPSKEDMPDVEPKDIILPSGGSGSVAVDSTLTASGKAADAKATGDAIRSLSEEKIERPVSGVVGQVLAVKTVDENGKPTEFACVYQTSGEGSGSEGEVVETTFKVWGPNATGASDGDVVTELNSGYYDKNGNQVQTSTFGCTVPLIEINEDATIYASVIQTTVWVKPAIDTIDRTCFAGSYRYLCEELLALFPNAQIFLTTVSHMNYFTVNPNDRYGKIAEQQRKCADIMSYTVIDWHAEGNLNTMMIGLNGSGTESDPYTPVGGNEYTTDLLHPNDKGGKRYGRLAGKVIAQKYLGF